MGIKIMGKTKTTTLDTTAGILTSNSHGKGHELGPHHADGRDEADMVHHYSQYRGGNRKYSFQLPEEAEEHRFPIQHASFENSSFLQKRKVSSD